MTYCEKLKEMYLDMDYMLESAKDKGIEYDQLFYAIASKYGIGQLAIKRRLQQMQNIGLIELQRDKVVLCKHLKNVKKI